MKSVITVLCRRSSTFKGDLMYTERTSLIVRGMLVTLFLFSINSSSHGQGGGQSPQNVTVVNGTSNPVPTTLQGTPNVNVSNTPTVNLSSSANTVQSQQSGTWNVGVIGTPIVGLSTSANTVQAQQAGSWSVGIVGTPTFALSSGTSVLVNNSAANPIPVVSVGGTPIQTTLLLNSGPVTIPNAPGLTDLGDFNASAFSKIRIVTRSTCTGLNGFIGVRLVVLEGGQPAQAIEEISPCADFPRFSSAVSKIIDMPGTTLRISVFQSDTFSTQQTVQVIVYGR
jgi:hypothetical protein